MNLYHKKYLFYQYTQFAPMGRTHIDASLNLRKKHKLMHIFMFCQNIKNMSVILVHHFFSPYALKTQGRKISHI